MDKAMRKALLAIIAVTVIASPMHGKPRAWVDGSAVISTAYLWRGDRVTGFHAAPDLRFHLGKFTLENYSFLALDGSYKEIDWDLSFTVGDFTFHAADYFARYDWYDGPEDWFSWKKGATNHIDEVALVYDSSAIPFTAKWFTFIWGDWIPDGEGNPGMASFSSYLELATYQSFGAFGTGYLIAGASVLKGSYTSYTRNFMPIHLELRYLKEFKAGSAGIPVGFSFMVNPFARTCHAAVWVGVSF